MFEQKDGFPELDLYSKPKHLISQQDGCLLTTLQQKVLMAKSEFQMILGTSIMKSACAKQFN